MIKIGRRSASGSVVGQDPHGAGCLHEHGMSVTQAADTLGISRATAYRSIDRYGIRVPRA
jgi:DNA-binding NtrC family response regulator